ncbi:rhomboid family intramembrane serine protease [Bremerella cremea]|uniref:Rhomboid family intramembrane serine protease n=1 Tax=Bremerella cremea TaxID=1031537 RepID=A0A368KXS5_9BACT|nr:rhomboid family intramembrane serine protease [Bremerella cremea]RCS53932.1 rhomboid family intramembrane serine protease [Bremerella cremea]
MRQIGKLASDQLASRFSDYLLTLGIHSKTDRASDGEYLLWIHEENQVDQARSELEAFRSNPDDARYRSAADEAAGIRKMEQLKERERRKNIHDVKPRGGVPGAGLSGAPVTKAIIVICVVIALLGMFASTHDLKDPGIGDEIYGAFSFLSPEDLQAYYISPDKDPLRSIKKGQVWRLITPALLHQNVGRMALLHVGFNMYMLYMLGPILERRLGSLQFLFLNVVLALASNLAQGVLPSILDETALVRFSNAYGGVQFLGYSGVIYGLFGFLWIRSSLDPTFGIMLVQSSIMILMVWFFLCWFGVIQNVANLAHTGGLVAGLLLGYLTAIMRR